MKKLSECTILIVDDTEENIDILVDALGDGYELTVATNGAAALKLIHRELPDLVLLDIMMPGMSGYEVCRKLKTDRRTEDIPVIFLTAMSDILSKTKAFEAGAIDYITKPFEITEVKARVQTHLSLQLAKTELSAQKDILEEKVQERTKELSLTQETTIEAMAFISEYRDPETGGHIKRTKNYVKSLAEKLRQLPKYSDQLSDEVISQLYNSAPLHDIGKVGIRDEVLLKEGKLTREEYEEMKMHAVIGFSALKLASLRLGNNSFLKYAMELARHHHEKWDGTGYPDGLKGEEIPLSARIMAVADVYDALISRRAYKPAFPHEKAVALIREARGTHLDPYIVDVFLEHNEEFRQIAAEYADYLDETEAG
ncbi:MAG TPA: two-component system response regulator [Eubacteriales bacterium]|nr:two-component system response regulator [Eubacteriales bacterium]